MTIQDTEIVWTDFSANHWVGCAKVSEGCMNCWSAGMADRFNRTPEPWTIDNLDVNLQMYDEHFVEQLESVDPGWVFSPSTSDPFVPGIEDNEEYWEWRKALISVDKHVYQVLTKWGPERDRAKQDAMPDEYEPRRTAGVWPRNVMMGVSVESPLRRYRIDWLREQNVETRFISFEPLVEHIPEVDLTGIDWIIVGGESHRKESERREMDPEWAVDLYKQARAQDTPILFKQHSGAYAEEKTTLRVPPDDEPREIHEFPEMPIDMVSAPRQFLGGETEEEVEVDG